MSIRIEAMKLEQRIKTNQRQRKEQTNKLTKRVNYILLFYEQLTCNSYINITFIFTRLYLKRIF